ncbi:MAG: 1-acyl-sn-glycerol-3-phosphate acyltransferase [Bacteroidales bacterium]|jgi:1-acyl-sn-glycerol-3-phosphate acyltransferase|nr:1-acyl-sn-glycerol-3-phosphate acyltransferase [Bacteroidales bacterium]
MDKFYAIRPYTEEEALVAMPAFIRDPNFVKAVDLLSPEITIATLEEELKQVKNIFDFQMMVSHHFIEYFVKIGTKGITFSGIEHIKPDEAYLFIANHRDIVFDSAILHHYFFANGFRVAKIAIGDNLLQSPSLTQFAKLNKMFLVKRALSIREKLANYQLLSEYIAQNILMENESIWIAQRNGRSKNGIDQTQHGLVKMLSMSGRKQPIKRLKALRLTPVCISYEYEPCARLKARETALSQHKNYTKLPGEDFNSIKEGLFGQKGRVHLAIGKPIGDELDLIDSQLTTNEKIVEVCRLVDKQIYQNYKLFPINYIAYDELEQSYDFAEYYTPGEKAAFMDYLLKQTVAGDVSLDVMFENLLHIYANPVKTCVLGETLANHDYED